MLRIILIDAHAVVGKANVAEIFETLLWLDLSSLFVVENTLIKLFHDESNTRYQFMHGCVFLVVFHSNF